MDRTSWDLERLHNFIGLNFITVKAQNYILSIFFVGGACIVFSIFIQWNPLIIGEFKNITNVYAVMVNLFRFAKIVHVINYSTLIFE